LAIRNPENEHVIKTSAIPTSKENESLWTVRDVAEYLRLKPETVRGMARRGELPCLKIGPRVWRFRPEEIRDWLDHNKES
jgi:excisionase family DNA binding protein